MHGSYGRFAAMIATSTAVMLGLMYLNTYALDHVFWSQTRFWMALVMGATMAIVMLAFMLHMYRNRMANAAIFIGAALVFAGSLYMVRSQATVSDVSWMKAMIPHHSIAIKRARSQLRQGPGLEHCEECDAGIPEARRKAVPGVRLCVACQDAHDREDAGAGGYNRRGSEDSQLR